MLRLEIPLAQWEAPDQLGGKQTSEHRGEGTTMAQAGVQQEVPTSSSQGRRATCPESGQQLGTGKVQMLLPGLWQLLRSRGTATRLSQGTGLDRLELGLHCTQAPLHLLGPCSSDSRGPTKSAFLWIPGRHTADLTASRCGQLDQSTQQPQSAVSHLKIHQKQAHGRTTKPTK